MAKYQNSKKHHLREKETSLTIVINITYKSKKHQNSNISYNNKKHPYSKKHHLEQLETPEN
jgi:hypothetical protein